MTRLQLMDAVYDALTRQSGTVGQQMSERCPIEAPIDLGQLQDCFQFRSKHESAGHGAIVERLDADPVACERQPAARPIPDGKRKHTSQRLDAIGSMLFI